MAVRALSHFCTVVEEVFRELKLFLSEADVVVNDLLESPPSKLSISRSTGVSGTVTASPSLAAIADILVSAKHKAAGFPSAFSMPSWPASLLVFDSSVWIVSSSTAQRRADLSSAPAPALACVSALAFRTSSLKAPSDNQSKSRGRRSLTDSSPSLKLTLTRAEEEPPEPLLDERRDDSLHILLPSALAPLSVDKLHLLEDDRDDDDDDDA
eukprot:CAMPEP_0113576320 /NCGR_PEP_ID=MMETSP0015_2-20120614/28230_1 /TAXON_ID=2838 /ORGANISM="Odontella" /LENGTH=210 /DNA_ID=CAMNT_0000479741 /DNA_START=110 /DNA_END=739 /DNA_ORIENTATION=+ /assembly_acc=CAM_ASM_000160